ncbi:MAG: hypothetical protein IKR73_01115 [Oscillospiraceae bacterium]|nr:hypothetical protein [Oscillospiraceae bacterium]
MKRTFATLCLSMILASGFTGCSTASKADFISPNSVIDATVDAHPIVDGEIHGMYDDLKGKTVSVKTNLYKENDIAFVYEDWYDSNKVWVTIGYLYDDKGEPLTDFDYKKGDTIVLEVEDVMFRGTKDGKIREYFINTTLPDE